MSRTEFSSRFGRGGACLLVVASALAWLFVAGAVHAQASTARAVETPPGGGQPALAVGFTSAGDVLARACARAPCRHDGGISLQVPPEVRALAVQGQMEVVKIGRARHAVHVFIPDPRQSRNWEAVVVATPGGKQPKVVFSGFTGWVQGEPGERRGPMVLISDPAQDGTRSIAIGEQREDMTLCGRAAVISPKLLLATDLELHSAKVQRLSAAERSGATRITAERVAERGGGPGPSVLRAVSATSAVGQPKALTDGDPNTTWAENRGRDGRGEFVLMQAPAELPIDAFEVVVRPPEAQPDQGVAPKVFYLVTTDAIFEVQMPEDAWAAPGARYRVPLPKPVRTDCVALVLESAFDTSRKARVTFAELAATSSFEGRSAEELVAELAGGGPKAEAAGAALRSLGAEGYAAVAKGFAKLDEGGRRVALDVMDEAPCATSSPVYVKALVGRYSEQRRHARTRLRRCGDDAAAALVAAIGRASPKARAALGDELALIAPARAVQALVPALAEAGPANARRRRAIRVVLARAAASERAFQAVSAALADASLDEVAVVDLLRAIGPRLPKYAPVASRTFNRLARPSASFRTRFLLLEPAAELAVKDSGALAYLRRALVADQSPYVRAEAAQVVRDPAQIPDEMKRALRDPQVRVREAAVRTLATPRGAFAAAGIIERLAEDPWPLVRSAAAEALAELGPGEAYDRALFEALQDESSHVRSPVLWALGHRRAIAYAPAVRERLGDSEESLYVRIAAAAALGVMCDMSAVDDLTDYALLLADPASAGPNRVIGPAALRALGRLHPPDLARRLAPLLSKQAPTLSRQAAQDVIDARGACQRKRAQ